MAEICQSPFDGDKHYDINVFGELDKNLYDASVALFNSSYFDAQDFEEQDNPDRE